MPLHGDAWPPVHTTHVVIRANEAKQLSSPVNSILLHLNSATLVPTWHPSAGYFRTGMQQ